MFHVYCLQIVFMSLESLTHHTRNRLSPTKFLKIVIVSMAGCIELFSCEGGDTYTRVKFQVLNSSLFLHYYNTLGLMILLSIRCKTASQAKSHCELLEWSLNMDDGILLHNYYSKDDSCTFDL